VRDWDWDWSIQRIKERNKPAQIMHLWPNVFCVSWQKLIDHPSNFINPPFPPFDCQLRMLKQSTLPRRSAQGNIHNLS
jgi:hypothetical protein